MSVAARLVAFAALLLAVFAAAALAGDLTHRGSSAEGDDGAAEERVVRGSEHDGGRGAYRPWVQFQLDGTVHTAAFTQEITT